MASTDDLVNFGADSGATSVDDLVGYGGIPQVAQAPEKPPVGRALTMGALRGAADIGNTVLNVLDYPAQALEAGFGTLGGPSVAEARQQRDQAVRDYNTEYGHSIPAMAGRIASSVALTAPVVSATGTALNPLVGNTLNALRATRLGRLGVNFLTGAAQGAETAAMTSGGYEEPVMDQVKSGALIGGAFGAAAPYIRKAGSAAYRTVTGSGMVNQNSAQLARTAVDEYGIPVRGSQITNSKFVKNLDSLLTRVPFSGIGKSDEEIASAFNRAAVSTIGGSGDDFAPQVVSQAKQAIGNKFEKVAANTVLKADSRFINDLNVVKSEAAQVLPSSELQPILSQIDNVSQAIQNGEISGKVYQTLTRKGTPLDRAIESSDPNISYYASRVREILDDALERSAPQDMRDLLKEARYQWKNYVTLKPLIEKSVDGKISPALLLNRVRQIWGDVDTGGGGDLGKLAKIGQQFLKPTSTSNTAENLAILGSVAAPTHVIPTLVGGRIGGSILGADWYRNMLLNSMNPTTVNPLIGGAVREAAIPFSVEAQRALSIPLVANSP